MQLDLLTNEAIFIIGYISTVFILFLMIVVACIKITNKSIKKYILEDDKTYLDTTKND
jgi:hypothetical protein